MSSSSIIIWTMTRTGGTNFAEHLLPLTPFTQVLHEPFNQGRIFGDVLQAEPFDSDCVRQKIVDVFATPRLIKYCVDAVPAKMAQMLLHVSLTVPMVHLFLYREDAVARLLSKWFAMNTGLWSGDLARFKQITGAPDLDTQRSLEQIDHDFYHSALPIEQLAAHESFQRGLFNQVYQVVRAHGVPMACLRFEDLYAGDGAVGKAQIEQALAIMQSMQLAQAPDDAVIDAWLHDLRAHGDQAMRAHYQGFSNIADLQRAIEQLPPFLS